ncbi:unnamed protein product [Clavelina lepadiformis]|uniref:Uncharacterized protein n=1 Tax=Clavelina lepadiformis TaxID=159417 RepID=A0ABP0FR38_CLALP
MRKVTHRKSGKTEHMPKFKMEFWKTGARCVCIRCFPAVCFTENSGRAVYGRVLLLFLRISAPCEVTISNTGVYVDGYLSGIIKKTMVLQSRLLYIGSSVIWQD